ncbi:MAG TPA: NifB/NifX family molybdenum-iron cluster-binding protein [bacterium]|nr:NifB/NifX family molybdenum-iron cluster-binding protein [bacterium]HPG44871.1 NifB/NifX family molybdenum-iron cluster-binding protein [bacterium]HPM98100.1 NifB/NifX family molybdenum-iron cluster-binding protein [bacterium]
MKIAFTAEGPTLDHNVEARFGRCPWFLIVDSETLEIEAIENPNIAVGGGAGIQSAQLLASKNVAAVLTGNCGPNAFQVFSAAGIQVITGISGPIRTAVERYKAGEFKSSSTANVTSHFGMHKGKNR